MPIAANDQVAGYWRGGQLGVMSYLSEDATANGVTFDGAAALREGRGINAGASSLRVIQATDDIRRFPLSLHLFARELGA